VKAAEALARLQSLGVVTVETADAAAALHLSTKAANHVLERLRKAKVITKLKSGLWLLARSSGTPYALAEAITAPFPSYVSLQTALYVHGMIDQVPGVVYLVSLARTQRIRTAIGAYSVHHIAPELFDGFAARVDGTKLATPEKALFDVAYLSGGRSRLFTHLPELELPSSFRAHRMDRWTAEIASPRKRSMVKRRLAEMLSRAEGGAVSGAEAKA
jgi:predicted transcriptional regulator of viral defense system